MKEINANDYFKVSPQVPILWDSKITEYADPKQTILYIETTNICNLKCTFCPHDIMKRKQGIMSESLFRKIIDEAAGIGIRKVSVSNFGEPLCDRDIVQRISYVKQKGIHDIALSTNGYLLTDALLTELFEAGLKRLSLSFAPFREYKQTRPGTNVERLFSTVLSLKNNPYLKNVSVNRVKTGISTREEEKEFFDLLKKHNLQIRGYLRKHNWNRTDNSSLSVSASPCLCFSLWMPTVLWDGRVVCCCTDFDGEHIVGDLSTQTITDVLNCGEIREIRRNHLAGKFLKFCLTCNTPKILNSQSEEKLYSLGFLWQCVKIRLFHSKSIVGYNPTLLEEFKLFAKIAQNYLVKKRTTVGARNAK